MFGFCPPVPTFCVVWLSRRLIDGPTSPGGAEAVVSPIIFDVPVAGYCGEVILKGVGAGFPATLGYGVPCVRAGHQCHAEALSKAGINTSPRFFGTDVKHLCVTVCVVYTFSDLGRVDHVSGGQWSEVSFALKSTMDRPRCALTHDCVHSRTKLV